MSVAIYCKVVRVAALADTEKKVIDGLVAKYSVDNDIEKYLKTGKGLNWESFSFSESNETKVVLSGSTALPNNTEDATWVGVQHWCKLLSEIRRLIPNAIWNVHVENHEIQWDSKAFAYDPNK